MAMKMAILEAPMAREYSIAHAKDRLAEAVRAAEAGEPVTLTRRGRPVAVIVSEAEYRRLPARAATSERLSRSSALPLTANATAPSRSTGSRCATATLDAK